MRTIIAGSRGITDPSIVAQAIEESGIVVSIVISGTAGGVDQLGEAYAEAHNIPVERYPADWKKLGKRAGYVRNELMASKAEALIAVWDGKSKGTKHMIDLAIKYKLRITVWRTDNVKVAT